MARYTDTPTQTEAPARASVHREPVVGVDDRVIGYTVTVTLAEDDHAPHLDPRVRDHVLHEHYLALDLASLVADRLVFVPAVGAMLDGFVPEVPDQRLVLDLPYGFELREDALRRAAALRSLGARLNLMGFAATPMQVSLLSQLDYVTVEPDVLVQPLAEVARTAHAAQVKVLAAGVRDLDLQARCLIGGVDALRGGLAERAAAAQVHGGPKVLRPGQLQCLAALHLLHQADVDLSEVAQIIDTDPVLTLRVLHLVNSGAFSLRTQVDTVQRAVVLLGVREVTALVAALAIDAKAGAMDSLWLILARALACEALADDPAAYTVGMLAGLVDQLGVPADVVLEKVGVSPTVADAVRDLAGELGPVLRAVKGHERGDLAAVEMAGFVPADVSDVYLSCLADALQTAKAVEG